MGASLNENFRFMVEDFSQISFVLVKLDILLFLIEFFSRRLLKGLYDPQDNFPHTSEMGWLDLRIRSGWLAICGNCGVYRIYGGAVSRETKTVSWDVEWQLLESWSI